ncbi:MAG: FAD/NAD(P)-binding:oxidoreductase [Thermogutta sp.]|uniref:ferric reductase-like transmembrane domain-containing protein n=1 Tax=Thermogutta sp. TaxID=1962930 RepID=UPI00199191EF|nr:ferric reductase-like transmembrane domain-containing protein [Thermogutta sp.]MBC7351252.1 FAD/NAD(P)-binding:oxidoreductase [Thermogutta sp.]
MNTHLFKRYFLVTGVLVFIGMPLLLYAVGDFPRRSLLKETLSIATLLSFSLMLSQFFLARSNMRVIELFDLRHVKKLHVYLAYTVVTVILLHPFFVVLPRFFEAGIPPKDAFITMVTSFHRSGIFFGLVAWCLLLLLVVTAFFRFRLIRLLHTDYPHWRHFHGMLSVLFTVCALVHVITLGRHIDAYLAGFYIAVAASGTFLLLRMYVPRSIVVKPQQSEPSGAKP